MLCGKSLGMLRAELRAALFCECYTQWLRRGPGNALRQTSGNAPCGVGQGMLCGKSLGMLCGKSLEMLCGKSPGMLPAAWGRECLLVMRVP